MVKAVGWTGCYDLEKPNVQQVDCLKGGSVFEESALCWETAPDRQAHAYIHR